MDDGTKIKLKVTIQPKEGSATFDFTWVTRKEVPITYTLVSLAPIVPTYVVCELCHFRQT
jgi:hypothetical protein